MIFSLNFVLSVNNIRSYLEGESQVHAQDTATSLGLSLSPYMVDVNDPIIETTMNAIFDMGYYQQVKLVDVDNKPLVTLVNNDQFEGVPQWFVELIPMETATAESEISSGWSIAGVVYVTINPSYAYLKLYEQAQSSFYFSLVAFVLSITLLMLVLRVTLSSLKRIEQMAVTIAKGQFETIEKIPWTTEVKNVTTSMNMMSRKIEGAISNLNTKLEVIGKRLHQDDLTGLNKKSSFETDMTTLFSAEQDVEAYVFVIKIDSLAAMVKELSNESIDQFLKDFANVLKNMEKQYDQEMISSYRFFGSEFVLLIRHADFERVEQVAKRLSIAFAEVGEKYKKRDIAHIGVVAFNPVDTMEGMLLAGNEAYEQAQLIGANSYYIRTGKDQAKDIAEWKSLVFSIVENEEYKVSYVGATDSFQTNQLLMEEAFTQGVDNKGEVIAIGTFVSIAEKFAKIVELDKGVTSRVIEYINEGQLSQSVAINLSTRTIKDSSFRVWLSKIIKQNQAVSAQLVFSISAYAIAKDMVVYKEFIAYVHHLGAKVMIKRFETQSMTPDMAKELKPDFIRLARDIGNGISTDEGKKAFVETMQGIGELLDIGILAENVTADNDYACIKAIGISGASR